MDCGSSTSICLVKKKKTGFAQTFKHVISISTPKTVVTQLVKGVWVWVGLLANELPEDIGTQKTVIRFIPILFTCIHFIRYGLSTIKWSVPFLRVDFVTQVILK